MSVRAVGILEHPFTTFEEIEAFPPRLLNVSEASRRVWEEYWEEDYPRDTSIPQIWKLTNFTPPKLSTPRQEWEMGHGPRIEGPGHTSIYFGRHCLVVNTVAKWRVATFRPCLLDAIGNLLSAIQDVLGSSGYLLCHDWGCQTWDIGFDAKSLDDAERVLQSERTDIVRVDTLRSLHNPDEDQPWQGYFRFRR